MFEAEETWRERVLRKALRPWMFAEDVHFSGILKSDEDCMHMLRAVSALG